MIRSLAIVVALGALSLASSCSSTDLSCQWAEFKSTYNKVYTAAEDERRYQVFVKTLDDIARKNTEQSEVTYGVNKFSDLTPVEFKANHLRTVKDLNKKKAKAGPAPTVVAKRSLPKNYTSPYLTPVRDQEYCGDCWAFSATGAVEAAWLKTNQETKQFAPEQLVDCDTQSDGCDGGYENLGLSYIVKLSKAGGGVMLESDYPYDGSRQTGRGTCSYSSSKAVGKLSSYWELDWDESDSGNVATALYTYSPLTISFNADSLQSYSSGVVQHSLACQNASDHAVLLVGWGVVGSQKYWLIKNSWGSTWGESGYFRLARGVNACNITQCVASACTAETSAASAIPTFLSVLVAAFLLSLHRV